MKQLEIIRLEKTEEGVLGVLLIEGIIFCHTLEHPTLLISTGTYPAVFEYSNKFKRKLYELLCTKDRTEIKIHVGNTVNDTEGCILLGKYTGQLNGERAVYASGDTIDLFHEALGGAEVNISVLDLTGL